MDEQEFQAFFGPGGYYRKNKRGAHNSWRDWSGYRSNGIGYSESSLLLPKDRELQKCINDLLTRDEEDWLPEYAEDVRSYFASIGGMWKNKWKKRASQLAAYKKHTEARRPQHDNTD